MIATLPASRPVAHFAASANNSVRRVPEKFTTGACLVEKSVRAPLHPPPGLRPCKVPTDRADTPEVEAVALSSHDQRVVDSGGRVAVEVDQQRSGEVADACGDEVLVAVALQHRVDARAALVRRAVGVPVVGAVLEPQLAGERRQAGVGGGTVRT